MKRKTKTKIIMQLLDDMDVFKAILAKQDKIIADMVKEKNSKKSKKTKKEVK